MNKDFVAEDFELMPVKLVEVVRSGVVESIHRGDIVVVNHEGKILYAVGDPDRLTFFRSAGKPIIALALLETGIVEEYKLDLKEMAIIASSHSGDAEHISILKSIIEKVGIDEEVLECGEHAPTGKKANRDLISSGLTPTKLHCDCSAKHIGLIAASKLSEINTKGYSKMEHPVQKRVEKVISEFCGVETGKIVKGIDGCGVPVHAVPLKNIALAYANLCYENFKEGKYRKSQNYIASAMTMYPEMIGGEGRFDTILMRCFGDRLLGKFGAEGVYCIGILGEGVGIAFKVEDGNDRGVGPAVLETLLQMKIIKKDEIDRIKDLWNPAILNNNGEQVGEVRAVFKLK